MSLQKLKEIGDQIIKAVESSPLQAEIAQISLESIHHLIVSTDQNAGVDDYRQPMHPNMYVDQQMGYPQQMLQQMYQFDEAMPPAVIGPQYSTDVMTQANSIPFLYHQNFPNQ